METADASTFKELDVILEIARGIRQSIKSSIADWTDIIGEEIETVEKIETLNFQEELMTQKLRQDNNSKMDQDDKIMEQLDHNQKEILTLLKKLPLSLQISSKNPQSKIDTIENVNKFLQNQIEKNGYIEARGFWDKTFEKDILEFNVGDKLTVQQGDVGKRTGAMVAYDKDLKSVGVIINSGSFQNKIFGLTYSEYFDALISFIGISRFQIELTEIEDPDPKNNRHYFRGKILK